MLNDNTISDFLLRDISIASGNKTLREGKLILFSSKDFYLHFTLEINGATKHFELPYPFGFMRVSDRLFLLDFSLSAFKTEFDNLEKKIKNIGNKKRSRYYNSIIRLHAS